MTQRNLSPSTSFLFFGAPLHNFRSDANGISTVTNNKIEAMKLQTTIAMNRVP